MNGQRDRQRDIQIEEYMDGWNGRQIDRRVDR
jgi:hypothetical protein